MTTKPDEAIREIALSTIPTGRLICEVLRRGGARLYGTIKGEECLWLRISPDATGIKKRPSQRVLIPSSWGTQARISDLEEEQL